MNTKKYFLGCIVWVLTLLLNPLLVQGQEQQKDTLSAKHEIRLDIFQLLILPGLDLSYEHFIDEVSSWGISGFLNFDGNKSQGYRFENFELSPYYRLYFSQKTWPNRGFFVQPFLSFVAGTFDSYDAFQFRENKFLGMAGGAVIGYKWLNRKNYSFEIHGGFGRYFLSANRGANTENTAYPRIHFTIGKRF
ncbi:MAG: hypothetical protein ACON47_08170 [Flavobacteriaceae bacterium]